MTVKNIVAQYERAGLVVDEVFAYDESLRQAVRAWLDGIPDVHAPLRSIAQQFREARGVVRGADQQHIADSAEHECTQGVVHHGLVVHGQQLFAESQSGGVQARAGASGKNDTFSR